MLHSFVRPVARSSRRIATLLTLSGLCAIAHAQLSISSFTDTPDPVPAGGTVTYALRIGEVNGLAVTGGTFSVDVPANGIFAGLGTVPPGVTCTGMTANQSGPGTLNCTGLSLSANAVEQTQFLVRSTTAAAGALQLTAHAAAGDQSQSTTVNNGADLSLFIIGPTTSSAGSATAFQLRVDNLGPDASPGSTLTYSIPTGFTVPSAPAGCSVIGSTLQCTLAGIPLNGNRVITVNGVVSAGNGSTLTHAASVAAGGGVGDGVTSNNSGTLNTSVTPGSTISVNKTKSVLDPVVTGSDFNLL